MIRQDMEEDGGGEPQETTFSGTPNAAPAEAPAGAFDQPAVMMGPKSSLPKVMGILMMLYGGIMGLLSLLGLLGIGDTIELYEELGVDFSTAFVYLEALTAVGVNFVVAYAGYQVFNYQKSGVKINNLFGCAEESISVHINRRGSEKENGLPICVFLCVIHGKAHSKGLCGTEFKLSAN